MTQTMLVSRRWCTDLPGRVLLRRHKCNHLPSFRCLACILSVLLPTCLGCGLGDVLPCPRWCLCCLSLAMLLEDRSQCIRSLRPSSLGGPVLGWLRLRHRNVTHWWWLKFNQGDVTHGSRLRLNRGDATKGRWSWLLVDNWPGTPMLFGKSA